MRSTLSTPLLPLASICPLFLVLAAGCDPIDFSENVAGEIGKPGEHGQEDWIPPSRPSVDGGVDIAPDVRPDTIPDVGPFVPPQPPVPPEQYVPGPCRPLAADETLARLQAGIVGVWQGAATFPSGWIRGGRPNPVELTFYCDGHYSARCLENDCTALYYGADGPHALKRYEINDVRRDGKGLGTITIFFSSSGTTTVDRIEALNLEANTLAFDIWHLDHYGPLEYALERVR